MRWTAAQIVSCFRLVCAQVRWHICTHLHCYSLFQYRDKRGFPESYSFHTNGDPWAESRSTTQSTWSGSHRRNRSPTTRTTHLDLENAVRDDPHPRSNQTVDGVRRHEDRGSKGSHGVVRGLPAVDPACLPLHHDAGIRGQRPPLPVGRRTFFVVLLSIMVFLGISCMKLEVQSASRTSRPVRREVPKRSIRQ